VCFLSIFLFFNIKVRVRANVRFRTRVKVKVRDMVRFRVKARVNFRDRVKVRVRIKVRKNRSTPKHNRILSTVTIKYLVIFVMKNPSSGIWSCPFSIIASKTFLNGCDIN
jgi:hypothetical protein